MMTSEERANFVSLKEHIEQRLAEQDKAQELFAKVLEGRLESVNHVKEVVRELLPRQEFVALHERVIEDIKSLRESRAAIEGKASQTSVMIAYVLAALGLVVAIAGLILNMK